MTELKTKTTLHWRRFLQTPEGQEGLLYLRENIPSVGGLGMDSSQIIFAAGVAEGYKRSFDTITSVLTLRKVEDEDLENPGLQPVR